MANIPDDLRYSEDHEWVKFDAASGVATVGITDYAQGELGDIVFVALPAAETEVERKASAGTIEAVKAVAELYSPVSGKVVESNSALEDAPETVNRDPYGEGWMVKIEVSDPSQLDDLMDAAAYSAHVG
ncbi:MAG TPA: glycine cleavage system protein GcvH [Gemmatimonadota bacterium]|nr:glycine cleavage system protein GcvH [Gemmatimonadota bacterium]